jgi:hypothetical protein
MMGDPVALRMVSTGSINQSIKTGPVIWEATYYIDAFALNR